MTLATGSEAQKLRFVTAESFSEEPTSPSAVPPPGAVGSRGDAAGVDDGPSAEGTMLDAVSQSLQVVRDQLGPDERTWLDHLASVRGEESRLVLSGPGSGPSTPSAIACGSSTPRPHRSRAGSASAASRTDRALRGHDRRRPARAPRRHGAGRVRRLSPLRSEGAEAGREFLPPRFAAFVLPATGEPVSFDIGAVDAVNTAVDVLRRRFVILPIAASVNAAAQRTTSWSPRLHRICCR